MKEVMQAEVQTFKDKVAGLESEMAEKEAASAAKLAEKEDALHGVDIEMSSLKDLLAASQ